MAEAVAVKKVVSKKKRERTLSPEFTALSKAVNSARKGAKSLSRFESIRKDAVQKLSEAVDIAQKVGAYSSDKASEIKTNMENANSSELQALAEEVIKHILYKKTVR